MTGFRHQTREWLFGLVGGLLLLFIIAPLAGLFLKTTQTGLFEAASDPVVQRSIGRTLLISFLGTMVFSLPAIPLAWLLARKSFRGRTIINGLIDIPIIIPHSAAGIAVLGFISRDSAVGKLAGALGLNLVGHPTGIALAMAFVSIPFLVNAARDGFASVPERYEKAALNLGASPLFVFFTISMPLAWKNILTGLILMFGRGMSEFGAVVIIAYHPMITPVLIYERFTNFGLKYAQPVSAVFIIICLVLFIMLRLLSPKRK
ncbi:MAG: ABC transporter permease [Bacteroidales bacterium]|nr:ABC transporter permease [Bacteroidales bacterium]